MAKELPFFKFETAKYLVGDIYYCSLEAQGLFINICVFYWQRECQLTKKQFLRRFNKPDLLDELVSDGVVKLEGDDIKISFLDSQLEEIQSFSNKQRENGKKGGRPKTQKNPTVNPEETQIKPKQKPIREDKKREEEIREENKRELFNNWISYKKEIKKPLKSDRSITALINKFNENSYDCCKWVVNNSIENQYQGLFWQNYKPQQSNNNNLPNGRRIAI